MSRLTEYLNPWSAAERGRHFDGVLALKEFPRLAGVLADREGEVRFALEFFLDSKRRACVRGTVEAVVHLRCQRCLEKLAFTVESRLMLSAVEGYEEARSLPEEYDPLMVEDGRVRPADLVEDEIILALPQVPMHPAGPDCALAQGRAGGEQAQAQRPEGERSDNPFEVLAQMKERIH